MKNIEREVKNMNPLLLMIIIIVVGMGLAYGFRGRETTGISTNDVTINYDDGSSRMISGDPSIWNKIRGTTLSTVVDDTGKKIESVDFTYKVKVKYSGNFYAGSITGSIKYIVNWQTKDTKTFSKTYSQSNPMPNDKWITVSTGSITKYGLDDWGKDGDNTFRVTNDAVVEIVWDDAEKSTKSGYSGFQFTYTMLAGAQGQIEGVETQIDHGFLY